MQFITINYEEKLFYKLEINPDDIKSISDITPYMEAREQLTQLTGKRATLIYEKDENVAEITGTILGFVLN